MLRRAQFGHIEIRSHRSFGCPLANHLADTLKPINDIVRRGHQSTAAMAHTVCRLLQLRHRLAGDDADLLETLTHSLADFVHFLDAALRGITEFAGTFAQVGIDQFDLARCALRRLPDLAGVALQGV